jgi:hypothetical protein
MGVQGVLIICLRGRLGACEVQDARRASAPTL